MNTPPFLSPAYWDQRYQKQSTGWDIGHVSTPLKEYFDQLSDKQMRILIPGAGNAYEALYLAEKGFTDITVIDFAPTVTERIKQSLTPKQKQSITILKGDFFELAGEYDLVIEQTFFCAIDPQLRKQYVEKVKTLLAGNGKLAGLLFNREFPENPPFGGTGKEYRQLFEREMRIKKLEPCYNSIPARKGSELFLIAEKIL